MENINYIGISKTQSLKFKNNSYLLNSEHKNGLVSGEKLIYGYLQNINSLGAKRGWFISKYSMVITDFNKYWNIESGIKIIKLNY